MKKILLISALLTASVATAQVAVQHDAQECNETAVVVANKVQLKADGALASPYYTMNNTGWYSGYAKSCYSLTNPMAHIPAYADVNFKVNKAESGATYQWKYVDPTVEYSMFNPMVTATGQSLTVNYPYAVPTTIEAPALTATNAVGDSVSTLPVYMRVGGPSTDNATTKTKYGWAYVSPKAGSLYYSSTYFATNAEKVNANWKNTTKVASDVNINVRGMGEFFPCQNPYALRGVQTHVREIAKISSPLTCTIYKVQLNDAKTLIKAVLDTVASQTIDPADFEAAGTSRYFLCFDKLVDHKTGKVVEGYTIKDDILVAITLPDEDTTSQVGFYYNGTVDDVPSHAVMVMAETIPSTSVNACENFYIAALNWSSGTKTRSLNVSLLGSYEYLLPAPAAQAAPAQSEDVEIAVDGDMKTFNMLSSVAYADEFGFLKEWTVEAPEWIKVACTDTYEDGVYMNKTKVVLTVTPNEGDEREGDVVLSFLGADYTIHVVQEGATTGINDVKVETEKARKVIENGQVIIVKGDARYNIMGQPVR